MSFLEFVSSVRWHFFVFRNSVEKLCVSWALSLVECVAVWAPKLPVPHTDVLKPTSHKVFLRNYWNPKELAANNRPHFCAYLGLFSYFFSFSPLLSQPASPFSPASPSQKKKVKRNPPKSYICNANIPLFGGFFLFFS